MRYFKIKIKDTYQHTHLSDNVYEPDQELLVVLFDKSQYRNLHGQYAHYTTSQRFDGRDTLDWIDKEYCEVLEEINYQEYIELKDGDLN